MEAPQGIVSSGVTVDEAPESYILAPRAENPNPNNPNSPNPVVNSIQFGNPPAMSAPPEGKKRGRPRKYGPDGSLSPMPISASIPLTSGGVDYSSPPSALKRGRGRGRAKGYLDSVKKFQRIEYRIPGEGVAYSFGANFTPHILEVNAGEDVTMKVMSFSRESDRAICILSATGPISNVTLRQPTSSGGTLTYEGRFEILSLSGSYILTDTGGTKSRTGGMSVSLAGPDGRVVGGGLAGLLVAAGPVQVVVGSFVPGGQQMEQQKKHRIETPPARVTVLTPEELKAAYAAAKPPAMNDIRPPSFNHVHMFMHPSSENKNSADEDEDSRSHEELKPPCEVTC